MARHVLAFAMLILVAACTTDSGTVRPQSRSGVGTGTYPDATSVNLYGDEGRLAQLYAERFRPRLFPNTAALWPDPRNIQVCWEGGAQSLVEAQWVRNRIRDEYETKTVIRFVGWAACAANSGGIRVRFFDMGPYAATIGRYLNGIPNGITLNRTFQNWGTACAKSEQERQRCIEVMALHEFGHAIGLAHEQNRPDTFGPNVNNTCTDSAQGPSGDTLWAAWDPDSVMNYCNPIWVNDGRLSALDVEGINSFYGGARRIADMGYFGWPRFMNDSDGNGTKDYCRFVGDAPRIFLSCKLTDANGFRTDSDYHFNSVQGLDRGYQALPQFMADVNGDRRGDYCRFVGDPPSVFLSCNLAGPSAFQQDQYGYNSVRGLDPGYPHWPRILADVNGDGRADFCRFVGDQPLIFLSCNLAGVTGFGQDQYAFNSKKGYDIGYAHLPRSMKDVNNDGRADFCRYVGDRPSIFLSCNLAGPNGFAEDQYGYKADVDKDAWYNK